MNGWQLMRRQYLLKVGTSRVVKLIKRSRIVGMYDRHKYELGINKNSALGINKNSAELVGHIRRMGLRKCIRNGE